MRHTQRLRGTQITAEIGGYMGGAQQVLRRPHLLAQLVVPDEVAAPKLGGDRVQASLAIS